MFDLAFTKMEAKIGIQEAKDKLANMASSFKSLEHRRMAMRLSRAQEWEIFIREHSLDLCIAAGGLIAIVLAGYW